MNDQRQFLGKLVLADGVLDDAIVDAAEGVEPAVAVFDVAVVDDVVAPQRIGPFLQIVGNLLFGLVVVL